MISNPDLARPPVQSHRFLILLGLIGLLIAGGLWAYLRQLSIGIGVTGLGRDVSWGLYIAQFTFAEGLAALVGRRAPDYQAAAKRAGFSDGMRSAEDSS